MAEPLVDAPAVAIVEEVDLSLDVADAAEAVAVAEEFDFELGQAELQRDDGDGPSSSLNKIEMGPDPDMDEINYEEETGHDALVPDQATDAETKLDAPAQDDGADEIDYEDTDVHATATHDNDDAAEGGEHHDIDFGFDDAGEGHAGDENDENDRGEYDHEEGDDSHQNNEDEDRDMSDFKQDEDEDDEDEENDENRTQHNAPSQQHYVVDDDEDSDSDSGLSPLQSFYPVTTFDVMVTWGDEVCPLFKTPDTNAPGSFYLEDYEAMNYPLSKFLQTIRSSISSWVRSSDEILIRVDELGLEFGETTTEALLGQVTFHNLLALHNTLVKNDDAEMTKGVHITLSTRSNCLLRLKDLVGGADSGKGLSAFPWTSSRADASSDDSGEVEEEEEEEEEEEDEEEAESGDSSPAGEADEMVEEDDGEEIEDDIEDEGEEDGVDVEMAARQSERSRSNSLEHEDGVAVEGFVETVVKEAERSELDTPTADEDPDAVEEADYINYTQDEVDDHVEGVHLNPDGVADLPTPHADGDELDFANAEDNLIDGLAADEAKLNEVDDLDLLEDINDAGDIVKNDQSGDAAAAEDDFLDLSGDIDDTAASAATLEASNKADDLEPSLDTSATATLDNDEIDYEDNRPEGEKNAAATLDAGGDEEIDWDVEIKNTASADATTTSPTSGKRTRDVDEAGDALLDDLPGEPPLKRQQVAFEFDDDDWPTLTFAT